MSQYIEGIKEETKEGTYTLFYTHLLIQAEMFETFGAHRSSSPDISQYDFYKSIFLHTIWHTCSPN